MGHFLTSSCNVLYQVLQQWAALMSPYSAIIYYLLSLHAKAMSLNFKVHSSLPPSLLSFLLVPPSILPSIDPSVIGTGVTMAPVCTTLTEPRVQLTVQPSLHDIFISTSTTDEKFHFGYICEGSTFVAKNISGNVSLTLHVWSV